jgi:hypothetical protein
VGQQGRLEGVLGHALRDGVAHLAPTLSNACVRARQRAFLKAFALTATISGAARAAKVIRAQVYAWREHDETFALEMQQAREEAYDRLEHEALRRAVEGVRRERPAAARMSRPFFVLIAMSNGPEGPSPLYQGCTSRDAAGTDAVPASNSANALTAK